MKIHLMGEHEKGQVRLNGKVLEIAPSLLLINHSPTGFSWGYNGSGPAQLALAILLYLYGEKTAMVSYQDFKADVIAQLPQADFVAVIDMDAWLDGQQGVIDFQDFPHPRL